MRILLTGATGYIGKRLLPVLLKDGHDVICCVRDRNRFNPPQTFSDRVTTIEIDMLKTDSLHRIPKNIDAAYYLIHSMSSSKEYAKLELQSASNFRMRLENTAVQHVIYLGGMVNEERLSPHLASRKAVEDELTLGKYHFTTLRAGIIIGSGSGSFEIIRDLVEKLPVMIAPRWLNTKCQPIGIREVIDFLDRALLDDRTYGQNFDIGGPDVLTYKEMLKGYAQLRGLRRLIITVPVMTPRLSSYWLYFITATSYRLATALVNSMKVEVVCRESQVNQLLRIDPAGYKVALERSFSAIEESRIVSSWKDALVSGRFDHSLSEFLTVPTHGCFVDHRKASVEIRDDCVEKIWKIGGDNGWYFADRLWKIRGFLDKLVGGVGLRRGRKDQSRISTGDAIDFWRVLYAKKKEGRLLLFAEMRIPGEAWLEFRIEGQVLHQTATFRPKGLLGRLYWYTLLPLHNLIFYGMSIRIAARKP